MTKAAVRSGFLVALLCAAILAALWAICAYVPVAAAAVGFAGFLAFLLTPLHRRLRGKASAWACLGIGMAPVIALLAAIPFLYTYLDDVLRALGDIQQDAEALAARLFSALHQNRLPPGFVTALQKRFDALLQGFSPEKAADAVVAFGERLPGLVWLITIPFFLYYFLRDREKIARGLTNIIPTKYRTGIKRLGQNAAHDIRQFLKAQVLVAAFVGTATGLLLWLCGIPYAPVWGVLHFLLNFIPYFGAWLGLIPVAVAAAPLGLPRVLLATAVVLVVQQAENLFVAPRLMSSKTGLHPAVVMAALMISGTVFGIGGLILTMPAVLLARCVIIWYKGEHNEARQ